MNVKVININKYNKKTEKGPFGYFRGYANIQIEDSDSDWIEIRDLSIYSDGKGKYFASIPRSKGNDNKWYELIYPSPKLILLINNAVQEAYKELVKPYKSPI